MEFKKYTVEELVKLDMLEKPMDGNHGSKHPTGKDYVKEGIPFIMVSDINNGKINYKTCKYISKETRNNLDKGFAKPDDVLLSHKATVGLTAIVGDEFEEIVLTPQLTYYRVKNNINNKYLKYYFDSPYFQNILKNWATSGSTRAYLGITAQLKLPILLPDINNQNKIANILSMIDRKIELNNHINNNLYEVAISYLQSKVNKEEVPINHFGKVQGGYAFKSKYLKDEVTKNRIIKIKNLRSEINADINNSQFVDDEVILKLDKKFELQKGDVVIAMTGAELGKTGFIYGKDRYYLNQRVGVVKGKNEKTELYLRVLMLSNFFQNLLNTKGYGSAQPNISTSDIESIMIKNITKENLDDLYKTIYPVYNKMLDNCEENEVLIQLRDMLLPKLINGEIDMKNIEV